MSVSLAGSEEAEGGGGDPGAFRHRRAGKIMKSWEISEVSGWEGLIKNHMAMGNL